MSQTLHATAAPAAPSFELGLSHISSSIRRWRDASRTRSALRGLSDRELSDLGIARSDISRIARDAANRPAR